MTTVSWSMEDEMVLKHCADDEQWRGGGGGAGEMATRVVGQRLKVKVEEPLAKLSHTEGAHVLIWITHSHRASESFDHRVITTEERSTPVLLSHTSGSLSSVPGTSCSVVLSRSREFFSLRLLLPSRFDLTMFMCDQWHRKILFSPGQLSFLLITS